MASTDTRSGFRLPWSSDRSQDPAAEGAAETEAVADAESEAPAAADPAWPKSDFNDALGLTRTQEQRPLEATQTPTELNEESSPMVDMDTAVAAAPAAAAAAPRKSSRMMVDLSAAIRATADTAQAQTLEQVHSESAQVVDAIRSSSTDGVTTLKQQSEDDIAAIREWSKAEIARIKDETDARITTRKATLEDELAGHAAAVDRRVDEVRAEVVRFEAAMTAYREGLDREDDPARLATMAEELPELPSFAAWADLGTLDISLAPDEAEADKPEAEAVAEVAGADVETLDANAIAERIGETSAPVEDWYAPAEDGSQPDEPSGVARTTAARTPGAIPRSCSRPAPVTRPTTRVMTCLAGPPVTCPMASRRAKARRPVIPSTAARSWPHSRQLPRPSSPPRPPPTPQRLPKRQPTSRRPRRSSSWAVRPTSSTTTPRLRRPWLPVSTRAVMRPRRSASGSPA
jgi:hypothetical protein